MKTLRNATLICVVIISLVFTAGIVRGDWDPGDPYKMHYPQLPDLNDTGLDVMASYPDPFITAAPLGKVLADDWRCSQSGPVTDIHIWGSWLFDVLPVGDPGAVTFRLSIHEDIPAGGDLNYSRPGPLLWEDTFAPGDPRWSVRLYATAFEQFYDPNLNTIVGTDTQVYQYNFFIDPANAFPQQEGTIYWLDVLALPVNNPNPQLAFGWKTSLDHFNDDAVYGDTIDPFVSPVEWSELRYPDGHEFQGNSIDLAFVITPEPVTMLILAAGLAPGLLRRRNKT